MSLEGESVMAMGRKRQLLTAKVWFLGLTIFFVSWLASAEIWATTLYVSDTTLDTILRAGPETSFRIVAPLRVGTQVTLIKEKNGWAEVALQNGVSGWTLKRYLSERVPWRITAEKLAADNQALQARVSQIGRSRQELSEENSKLKEQLDTERRELKALRKDYEALKKGAANYLGLKNAFEKLTLEARQAREGLDDVQKAHKKLKSSSSIRWFISGAGVLILGWLVGLSMGRMRRRRSSEIYR